MIRQFNYTNRKRIPKEKVHVALKEQGQKPPSFDATVDLSDLKLPEDDTSLRGSLLPGLVYALRFRYCSPR